GGDVGGKSDRSAIKSRAERSNRALSDQIDADSLIRAPARALVGWLVDPSLPNEGKDQKPTHPPKTRARKTAQAPPLDAHQQLAFELLVDREVGIDHEVAEILAKSASPLDIYRLVDNWLPDYRDGKVRQGA